MSLPISHVMRAKVEFCEENTSLRKLSEKMLSKDVGSVLVKKRRKEYWYYNNK